MTTLMGEWPEPDTETVAQRLRMHMGDKKIARSKLALASGIKRSALSNKLDGRSEFSIDEIVAIAHALNRSWIWVLTGQNGPDSPPGGGGGSAIPADESLLSESDRRHLAYKVFALPALKQAA